MRRKVDIYSRLNARMHSYIDAVNRKADPEFIHMELRDLISEAIKMEIGLNELMMIFSSQIEESGSIEFENNVAKRYAQGIKRSKSHPH